MELFEQCKKWIDSFGKSVSLFDVESDGLTVKNYTFTSRSKKKVRLLKRSPEMEAKVLFESQKVLADFYDQGNQYDGLIYLVYFENPLVLLYVGVCGKFGRDHRNLNRNLEDIFRVFYYYARWGDDVARHIGALSNEIFDNGFKKEVKYWRFANALFEDYETCRLKQPVSFSFFAWGKDNVDYRGNHISLLNLEHDLIKTFRPIVNQKVKEKKRKKVKATGKQLKLLSSLLALVTFSF